jgi:hypothetical protein
MIIHRIIPMYNRGNINSLNVGGRSFGIIYGSSSSKPLFTSNTPQNDNIFELFGASPATQLLYVSDVSRTYIPVVTLPNTVNSVLLIVYSGDGKLKFEGFGSVVRRGSNNNFTFQNIVFDQEDIVNLSVNGMKSTDIGTISFY